MTTRSLIALVFGITCGFFVTDGAAAAKQKPIKLSIPLIPISQVSIELKDLMEVDGDLYPSGSGLKLFVKDKISDGIISRYQWQKNGVSLDGSNANELVIITTPSTVGFYTCFITETKIKQSFWKTSPAQRAWVTAPYEIQVVSGGSVKLAKADQSEVSLASVNAEKKNAGPHESEIPEFALISGSLTNSGGTQPIIVTATPIVSSGNSGQCPGAYRGYINFRKSLSSGWGWVQNSTTGLHRAVDPNRTTTKVEFIDKNGLMLVNNCNTGFVDVPTPNNGNPLDVPFRFTIYFPTTPIPATYSIRLEGFDP